jgi:hypothetical protein
VFVILSLHPPFVVQTGKHGAAIEGKLSSPCARQQKSICAQQTLQSQRMEFIVSDLHEGEFNLYM